jgi:hypothetical protein
MHDARSILLDRLDLVSRELAALRDLVAGAPGATAPTEAVAAPVAAEPEAEELPPEPEGDLTIDPNQAADILGVARQTVDRRLKEGLVNVPGGPVDTSRGAVRSRWRWRSESDVRRWWGAVK